MFVLEVRVQYTINNIISMSEFVIAEAQVFCNTPISLTNGTHPGGTSEFVPDTSVMQ